MIEFLKKLLGWRTSPDITPAVAGETEVAMSDPITTVTPPAVSGGITKSELEALLKPLADTVASLASGHKALQEAFKASPAMKPEDVARAVTEQLDARQKVQTEASAKSAAKTALRDKVIAAKLPGVPKELLSALPDLEDENALTAAADTLRKSLDGLGVKLADTKSATTDGGKTAQQDQAAKAGNTGFLKMPDAAPRTAPATAAAPAAKA